MSYKVIPEIPKAERLTWSSERGGRTRQRVGGKWVRKFSYSPFTAKAYEEYSFYADIVTTQEIESPPDSGKKKKNITILAHVGTYLEFRDAVKSGEVRERLDALVEVSGGGEIESISYWRNRGEARIEGENL